MWGMSDTSQSDLDASRPRRPIDPKILPALIGFISVTVTVIVTRKAPTEVQILAWSGSAGTLIACWMQARKCKKAHDGVERAEKSVPGITTVNGPTAPVTIIKNDSSLPGPPTVTHPPNEGENI